MSGQLELRYIVAEAIVRTADRPAHNRGPWIFNERALQSKADDARAYLAALEPKP